MYTEQCAEVLEQREHVGTKERSRFDDQIMAASERLEQIGEQHQHLSTLPIGQPDPIPKRAMAEARCPWQGRQARTYAAEIAEQALKLRERLDKKQRPNMPGVAQQEERDGESGSSYAGTRTSGVHSARLGW